MGSAILAAVPFVPLRGGILGADYTDGPKARD